MGRPNKTLRGRRLHASTESLCTGTGRSAGRSPYVERRDASRRSGPQDANARRAEVGQVPSTNEAVEQSGHSRGGAVEGRIFFKGEHGPAKHAPDAVGVSVPLDRVRQCAKGQEIQVQQSDSPSHRRTTPASVLGAKTTGERWRRRRDVGAAPDVHTRDWHGRLKPLTSRSQQSSTKAT